MSTVTLQVHYQEEDSSFGTEEFDVNVNDTFETFLNNFTVNFELNEKNYKVVVNNEQVDEELLIGDALPEGGSVRLIQKNLAA